MEPAGNGVGERWNRRLWLVAWALTGIALYLTGLTLWTVWVARSEVPWRDQWTYIDDAREIMAHHWSRLWYSYWGHRIVISRLFAVLDVRFWKTLSSPVLACDLATQALHTALLVWIGWQLFARRSKPIFLILAALIVQLSFSSLQMENFIWAADPGYLLVWTTATAAFVALALVPARPGLIPAPVWGSILLGIISTLSCPNGIFVWPVLVLQSWILRLKMRIRVLLAICGALMIAAYLWHYDPGPDLGMGAGRAILHPWQSVPIVGMLAAATLTSVSVLCAMIAGCVALAAVAYILVKVWRYHPPALLTAYGALAVFALLTLAGMMTSRISPEFIAERVRLHLLVFPSRYYTTVFFFWASLGGVSLWMAMKNSHEWPQLVVTGSMVAVVTLGTLFWQIGEAANWRGYYREIDVAGSALIMHVDDPANAALQQIYPDPVFRDRISAWLEQRRMALFSQQRGRLVGQRIGELESGGCGGQAEIAAPVGQGVYRITGWAASPSQDLVFANHAGLIVGVARSGLRRPDLAPADAGWQGYARTDAPSVEVFAVLDHSGHYCRIGQPIALPVK